MASPSVVVVAARVPPVSGQSVATEMLLRQLHAHGLPFAVADLSRPLHLNRGLLARVGRAARLARLAPDLVRGGGALAGPVVGYLQLGQSHDAMARDVMILACFRWRRWTAVAHIHGGGFRMAFDTAPRALRYMLGRALGRVARVVVLTPRLGPMLSGIVPDERVVAVDNGVEQEVVDAAVRRDDQERPRAGRPLTALYLSNLMASKGYVTVLEAAALAAARGMGLQFVLAGDRTWDTAVDPERFIRDRGLRNVRYCGPVHGEAKAAVLSDADVLVLPTAYPVEGQPLAILEAMHFGLPVVTCEHGGIADVIRPGENGLLVPPRNPAALLAAVSALAEQPMLARRMGEVNQRTARARYTEVAHGCAMVGVLRDAVSAGTAGCTPPASLGDGRGAGTGRRNVARKQRVHHLDGGCW